MTVDPYDLSSAKSPREWEYVGDIEDAELREQGRLMALYIDPGTGNPDQDLYLRMQAVQTSLGITMSRRARGLPSYDDLSLSELGLSHLRCPESPWEERHVWRERRFGRGPEMVCQSCGIDMISLGGQPLPGFKPHKRRWERSAA